MVRPSERRGVVAEISLVSRGGLLGRRRRGWLLLLLLLLLHGWPDVSNVTAVHGHSGGLRAAEEALAHLNI